MSIWEQIIHDLKTNDNGARFTTGQNYESALHSFRAIMGDDAIKGFDINVAEIQKWKEGMKNGVMGKNILIVIPLIESHPVVAADKQNKLPVGIRVGQSL